MHMKIKPKMRHECAKCNKRFEKPYQLRNHIKSIHEDIKPYPCGQCEKAFSGANYLKKHVNIKHEGLKNYKCEECSNTFGFPQKPYQKYAQRT